MNDRLEFWEKPKAKEVYMLVGWRQWADAGSISSVLPDYLVERFKGSKIGELKPKDFYMFQIPGTHHFMRPTIKLKDGYRQSLEVNRNEYYYIGDDEKGLVVFLGDEPHLNVEAYADAFFDAADYLGVKRIVVVGGVYGSMPYDKARDVSCVYSLKYMKHELDRYAVRYSNYEGGATIGSYLLDAAEKREVEFMVMYAFVPAYDFAESSALPNGIRIENDYKAWHDIMRRVNHMFGLSLDLEHLRGRSDELVTFMDAKVRELEKEMPQLKIREYLAQIDEQFTERYFSPLGDVWDQGLQDLFGDDGD
ncbi:MAG: PAC2 family protein [Chloroflexota bacterium]